MKKKRIEPINFETPAPVKKLAKPKKPGKSSLRWYREEWKKMGRKGTPEAMVEVLAQLSYTQKRLLQRVTYLEESVTQSAAEIYELRVSVISLLGVIANGGRRPTGSDDVLKAFESN